MSGGLGRRPLPDGDTKHLERYGMSRQAPADPVERTLKLPYQYHPQYDQGQEGACVGFAASWAMSILNRQFYDARWLYHEAQRQDEWPGEDYSGTSVRAAMDVLRTVGHRLLHRHRHEHLADVRHGVERNEWAVHADQVRSCIANNIPVVLGIDWFSNFDLPVKRGKDYWIGQGNLGRIHGGHAICAYGASDRRQAVKLTNSWGSRYPPVWLPYDVLQRLLDNGGEATVITDRLPS